MKLYLCTFVREHHEYPDKNWSEERDYALVWAEDAAEALTKLDKAERVDDPYGHSIRVDRSRASEAIT